MVAAPYLAGVLGPFEVTLEAGKVGQKHKGPPKAK